MTNDTPDGRGSKRVRELAVLLKQSQAERNRSFTELPTTQQLYRGFPFHDGSLERDIYVWVPPRVRMLQAYGGQCAALAVLLNSLQDNPCAETAHAAADLAQQILGWDVDDVPARALDEVADARWRLVYYSWRMGSERAGPMVADAVFDMVKSASDMLAKAELWATAWETVIARAPVTHDEWHRQRGHGSAMDDLAQIGLIAFDVLQAKARLAGEQEKRRREEHGKALRELLSNPAGGVQQDITQCIPDDIEVETAHAPQPGRVVLGPLDHLSTHRDSPRLQYERHANVPLRCVPAPDASAMADALVAKYPWAEAGIRRLCGMLVGQPYAVFRNPVLFLGSQGCGKTALLRDVGAFMGVPVTIFGCGGVGDNGFGGTSRQYATHRPSVPAQAMFQASTATVLIGLDELEKSTHGGHNGSVRDGLLGMVEPSMRGKHWDVCLETDIDLSLVSFIATANSAEPLRGPLLDRFTVIPILDPRREDLDVIVRGLLDRLRQESGLDPRFIADLDPTEQDVLRRAWRGGSIRPLARAVERLVALRQSPNLAH